MWQYSKRRAAHDNQTRNAQEARALEAVDGDQPPKATRFVKTTAGGRSLDTASLERARFLVGLKGHVTNIPRAPYYREPALPRSCRPVISVYLIVFAHLPAGRDNKPTRQESVLV